MIAPLKDLGRLIGLQEKAAYKWRHASKWRGAGDMPPDANRKLLAYAEEKGIPLTADHLVRGADLAEIEALMSDRAA